MNKFNSGAAGGGRQNDDEDEDGSQFMSNFFGDKIANDYADERPIKAKGTYHVPSSQEMQGIDEIEDVKFTQNYTENDAAEEDSGLFVKVMENMQNFLKKQVTLKKE